MSDEFRQPGAPEPVRITDKREQRRQEAAAAAAQRAAEAGHPTLDDETAEQLLRRQAEMELERDAEREAAAEVREARTAFLVIVGHDGSAVATSDVNVELSIDHEANVDEMYAGVMLVKRDIEAAMTGKHVVFGMQVSAQAMQQQAQAARLMQQPGMMPPGMRR